MKQIRSVQESGQKMARKFAQNGLVPATLPGLPTLILVTDGGGCGSWVARTRQQVSPHPPLKPALQPRGLACPGDHMAAVVGVCGLGAQRQWVNEASPFCARIGPKNGPEVCTEQTCSRNPPRTPNSHPGDRWGWLRVLGRTDAAAGEPASSERKKDLRPLPGVC